LENLSLVEKKFLASFLICIILATGFVGVAMLLNLKEDEIKIKIEQLIEWKIRRTHLKPNMQAARQRILCSTMKLTV
jgi:hypothetical protein